MSKSRVFLYCVLGFLAGAGVRSFFVAPLFLAIGIECGALALIFFGIFFEKPKVWFLFLVVCCAGAGVLRYEAVEQGMPLLRVDTVGAPVVLSGRIAEVVASGSTQRMVVAVQLTDTGKSNAAVEVLTSRYPGFRPDEKVQIKGALRPLQSDANSRELLLGVQGIILYPQIQKMEDARMIPAFLQRLREYINGRIDVILPEPHAAFLNGLLFGDRSALPSSLLADFSATGTSHIVAVSGYNVSLISRQVMNALLAAAVPFGLATFLSGAGIVFFVLFTGASSSVVRAGIMGLLLLIAEREGRQYQIRNGMAAAAAAMVWYNPRVLRFDAGFQLSFLATLGIVFVAPRLLSFFENLRTRWLVRVHGRIMSDDISEIPRGWQSRASRMLMQVLAETLAAELCVLPLLLWVSGRVSLISPIANVVILSAVPAAMGLGFAAIIVSILHVSLGRSAALGVWFLLEYMLKAVHMLAAVPLASIEFYGYMKWIVLGVCAFVVWRLLIGKQKFIRKADS